MNRPKLLIIIVLLFVLIIGFLFTQKGASKKLLQSPDVTQPTTAQDGSPAVTEAIKNESYKSGISLEITAPQANATVSTSTITIKGKTSPNAEVFVNDKELKADRSGTFSTTVSLEEGENPIVVVANDEDGNSAEQQLLVTYQQ